MSRFLITLCVLTLALAPAFADKPNEPPGKEVEIADLALRELSSLLEPREGVAVGDLKVRDVRELLAESSVRIQEVQFVTDVRRISWFMPGAGNFKAGDKQSGAAYLTANIVITAGTLVGAYFLLPSELRFDHTDYVGDSYQEIETAWKSQSLTDFLPSIGVLAGGFAVRALLGYFASQSAERAAIEGIRDGRIRFEPYAAADRLGLKATWRQ